MSNVTPDAWIERHWLDEPPSEHPCEDGICAHVHHCDVCERPMDYESDSGCCLVCDNEWQASHQLGCWEQQSCIFCGQLSYGSRGRATGILYRSVCPACMDKENEAAERQLEIQVKTFNAIEHFLNV